MLISCRYFQYKLLNANILLGNDPVQDGVYVGYCPGIWTITLDPFSWQFTGCSSMQNMINWLNSQLGDVNDPDCVANGTCDFQDDTKYPWSTTVGGQAHGGVYEADFADATSTSPTSVTPVTSTSLSAQDSFFRAGGAWGSGISPPWIAGPGGGVGNACCSASIVAFKMSAQMYVFCGFLPGGSSCCREPTWCEDCGKGIYIPMPPFELCASNYNNQIFTVGNGGYGINLGYSVYTQTGQTSPNNLPNTNFVRCTPSTDCLTPDPFSGDDAP